MSDRFGPDTTCLFGYGACQGPSSPDAIDGCPNYWSCRGAQKGRRPGDESLCRRFASEDKCATAQNVRRLIGDR